MERINLVFLNLWIVGSNEYMDRESIHHLTNLTVLVALGLLMTGFVFHFKATVYSHTEFLILIVSPIFYFNLLGKYRGYLFRESKFIQVAPMFVDHQIRYE